MSYQIPNGFIPYPSNPDLYYCEKSVYDQSGNQFREITYFSVSTGQTQVNHYPVENAQQAPAPQYQVQNNSAAVKTAPKKSRAGLFVTLSIIILLIAGGLTMWLTGVYKMLPFFGSGTAIEESMNFAMGSGHSVFLQDDGTVVATGNNEMGQCNVETWTDIIAVDVNGGYTVGLKSDGTVVATGDNYFKQCNVEEWTDIVQISAGAINTIGLKSDGTVVNTDSDNEYGRSEDYTNEWTDIEKVAIPGNGIPIGYTTNGDILIARDFNQLELNTINTFTDAKKIEVFGFFNDEDKYVEAYIAFKNNGEVLIETTDTNEYSVQLVEDLKQKLDLSNIADVYFYETLGVIYKDGTVKTFNVYDDFNEVEEINTSKLTDVVAIRCDRDNIIALKSDGTFATSGENYYGELNLEEIGIPVS